METKTKTWEMGNVIEQLAPNPINHKPGENGCCKNPRAWEMEMMHQVWAAGLHDAANCFQDALEAKWKLESQRKLKPKTNGDKIRSMTDKEMAKILNGGCPPGGAKCNGRCGLCWLDWFRSPVEESPSGE